MRPHPLLEGVMVAQDAGPPSNGSTPQGLRLLIHIDGAARGNPGPAGIGAMVTAGDRAFDRDLYRYIGHATNNVAEYEALLLALREIVTFQPAVVAIRSDSELLVKQVQGKYRVRNPRLAVLYTQALALIHQLSTAGCRFSIEHVGREFNRQADALANRAIDEALAGIPQAGKHS
jgi:ribonuclease HI